MPNNVIAANKAVANKDSITTISMHGINPEKQEYWDKRLSEILGTMPMHTMGDICDAVNGAADTIIPSSKSKLIKAIYKLDNFQLLREQFKNLMWSQIISLGILSITVKLYKFFCGNRYIEKKEAIADLLCIILHRKHIYAYDYMEQDHCAESTASAEIATSDSKENCGHDTQEKGMCSYKKEEEEDSLTAETPSTEVVASNSQVTYSIPLSKT